MLNPMRDKKKNEGTYRWGEKGRHLCQRLVLKQTAEGKTSYKLSWKVKVMKTRAKNVLPVELQCSKISQHFPT